MEVIEKFPRDVLQKAIGEANALFAEGEILLRNVKEEGTPVTTQEKSSLVAGDGTNPEARRAEGLEMQPNQPAGAHEGVHGQWEMLETPRKEPVTV